MKLVFSTTRSPVSAVIRYATWSKYSHVELLTPDNTLLGADALARKVIEIPVEERLKKVSKFVVMDSIHIDSFDVTNIARTQLGKPYDWGALLGWGFKRDWQEDDRWMCSELIAWVAETNGTPLLNADGFHRITPRDLLLSPYLFESTL